MANIDFAIWLESERVARGWPQTLLAERAELSDTQMSRLMRGDRQPGIDSIKGIARALGVPIETVMRHAGWLPDYGELLPETRGWSARLRSLTSEQREAALVAMEAALRVAEVGDRARRGR